MTLVPVGDPTSGEICMMVLPEATGGVANYDPARRQAGGTCRGRVPVVKVSLGF